MVSYMYVLKKNEELARETHWVLVCVLSFHFCKSDYIAREENARVMRKTAHTHTRSRCTFIYKTVHSQRFTSID